MRAPRLREARPEGRLGSNSRNGRRPKTLKTDQGDLEIEVPRDREGSFEPEIVKKRQTRFFQGHLEELYGVELSPTLISSAMSAVMEDVVA